MGLNQPRRRYRLLSSSVALAAISFVSTSAQAESRINRGTQDWAAAAQSGRADMLLLGDSITAYGEWGWSNGIARAAEGSVGLAGSGLLTPSNDLPGVWGVYTGARVWSGVPRESPASGVPSLTPAARHFDVGPNFAFVGTGNDAVKLDLTKQIDWHVVAAGTSAEAQLQATRQRRVQVPYHQSTIETGPITPIGMTAQDHVFRLNASNDPGEWNSFSFTDASKDASIYYTKLVETNSTGITVSAWSYSGGTTQGFRDAYYNHNRFTEAGRDVFYQSLVSGNSGKLNVGIAFGVNDANNVTPEQYGQNIAGLIADVRRDWADAGFDADDLSFSLLSSYQVNANLYSPAAFAVLNEYRAVLDAIAAGDEQVSFIDVWGTGPTWQEAVANGYLADNVHPTLAGTEVYGNLVLQQLLPEPASLTVLAGGLLIVRRRRAR